MGRRRAEFPDTLIKDLCKRPPWGLRWHVVRSLRWIDPTHLGGLDGVYLLDDLKAPTPDGEHWYRRAFEEQHAIFGWYKPRSAEEGPYIVQNIRAIYKGVPRHYWWTPVPTVLLAQHLAHEVAHHLIALRGYALRQDLNREGSNSEEEEANLYSKHVLNRMQAAKPYRWGQSLIVYLSGTHYVIGAEAWRQGRYLEAKERFYTAVLLDPSNKLARDWYWWTKRRIEEGETS